MADEFHDRQFGVVGEVLPSRSSTPPPAPPQPLDIPPPDWAAEERERRERGEQPQPSGPRPSALETMLAADARELPPPRALEGPPIRLEPLRHFEVPEVDWRQEQRERERQAREGGGSC